MNANILYSRVLLCGVVLALAYAALLTSMKVGLPGSAALAQNAAPSYTVVEDHTCQQERKCDGLSYGSCEPHGFFCSDDTCTEQGSCSWYYDWECVECTDTDCAHGNRDEISRDCAPYCKWISYNQCACSCKRSDDPDSVEAGPVYQCWDLNSTCLVLGPA